jgi:hypothetical protein
MADVLKSEGLVIAYTLGGNIYPLACTKSASIDISREFLELSPKDNNTYRRYIPTRRSFNVSGNGLVKISESFMHGIDFFEDMFTTVDTLYTCYLDLIDAQNNYRIYQFNAYIESLNLESTSGTFPKYSFSLIGSGAFTELTIVDTYTVSGGTIPARSTATHKLVAVGYRGNWYYNYTVSAGPVINLGASLNGVSVVAAYIAL